MMDWQQFLNENATRYIEARDWLAAGMSWDDVLKTWHKGDDLLWAAEEMGLIDSDAATAFACDCVDALEYYAPDVKDVTKAIRKKDKQLARHEVMGIEGAIPRHDIEPVDPELEPVIPASDVPIETPAANKARFAASLLLDKPNHNVMHYAMQAKVADARAAFVEVLKEYEKLQASKEPDFAELCRIKSVMQELEDAIKRVESAENLRQADAVRELLRGLA